MTLVKFCTNCGTKISDLAGACSRCASFPFDHACSACGAVIVAGSRFCGSCGNLASRGSGTLKMARPLVTEWAPELEDAVSERREVTVIFVDVTDFTSVSESLDNEDVYNFIDEAMKLLAGVISDYEGTIDKFTGDGLMAVFGVPQAHENDAERAVRAAWEMQRAVEALRKRLRAQYGFDFRLRIGIHTGDVVAGRLGSSVHSEYTVIGDTVNLAARLEAAAEPDTVYVSSTTYERTAANIRYERVGPLNLKGISREVAAYRVAGVRTGTGERRGVPGMTVPLVGRDIPLSMLDAALGRMLKTGFGTVCIVGDPGMGKTRLAHEFLSHLNEDVRVVTTRCVALSRSRPLAAAAALLRSLIGVEETDSPHTQYAAIAASLQANDLPDEIAPYLASVLGVLEACEVENGLASLDESMLQQQTHAAMRMLILTIAKEKPLVVLHDDLHWLDAASRDLLTYLVQSNPQERVLLLFVTRPTERETWLAPLIEAASIDESRYLEIVLKPLAVSEARALARTLIPVETLEASNIRHKIVARAEGNPFYVEELVRMLIDRGGLAGEPGAWAITPQAEKLLEELPSSLRGLILTRADALPRELRSILQRAAVLGRSFSVRLLQRVMSDSNIDVSSALDDLARRDFLMQEAFGLERGYSFRHVLFQEAIHSTLLKRDRQELHRLVAETIEDGEAWPEAERNEALAHHWAESAEPSRAVPYLLAAAEYSSRRHANQAASDHCRRALHILRQSPDSSANVRANLILGRALKFLGRLGEAKDVLAECVRELYAHLSDDGAHVSQVAIFVEALRELADVKAREGNLDEAFRHLEEAFLAVAEWKDIESSTLRYSVQERMAWIRFRQGNLADALVRSDELSKSLESQPDGDRAILASVLNTLAGVLWQYGKLDLATPYIRQSLALYHKLGYLFGKATAHMNLGVLLYAQGNWSEAASSFERSEWLRREIGYMVGRASNLYNLGLLRMALGEHARARTDLQSSLSIAEQLGEELEIVHALTGLAQLEVISGRHKEADAWLARIEPHTPGLDADDRVQIQWIRALVESDRCLESAIALVEEGCRIAKAMSLPESEADCARVLGLLEARRSNAKAAADALQRSIDLARKLGDPYREGLALLEMGTAYAERKIEGESAATRGRALLEESLRLFTKLGAAHDAERATSALHAVS